MGLVFQTAYRDVDWIRATWFGNDWVTLLVAVPLLLTGFVRAAAGSTRGLLLWLGLIGYALYNYAFYLFGAALNAFFPLYVAALVLAATLLILALSHIEARRVAESFRPTTPVRFIGGSLTVRRTRVGVCLDRDVGLLHLRGRPTPIETEAFKLVAALDSSLHGPHPYSGRRSGRVSAISTLHSGVADELLVYDVREAVAEGEAMDLAHGASFYPPPSSATQVDVLTQRMTEVSGLPAARIIGTGTMLDTARLKQITGRIIHVLWLEGSLEAIARRVSAPLHSP